MRKPKYRRDDHNTPTNTQREFMGVAPRKIIFQPIGSRGVGKSFPSAWMMDIARCGPFPPIVILKLKGDL